MEQREDLEGLPPKAKILGALLGWMSFPSPHGVALRLETARSSKQIADRQIEHHIITLNTRQLRALAHDLGKIADQHEGIERAYQPKRWFRR